MGRLLLGLLLLAASLSAGAEQVLRKGNGAEPQTLDPHRATDVSSANILRDLFEGLVTGAPDGSLAPGVAARWTLSDDGRIYTFHLRENARWSNGDPVTAQDFVFSLRRSVDPATGSPYGQMLAPIQHADAIVAGERPPEDLGVTALGPRTLRIHLEAPTPYFLGLLAHSIAYPVHPATVREHGDQFTRPGRLVSNGAYRLHEWVVQSHILLTRNPHYRDAANTAIDRVFYYPIEDQASELKRYRAGEIDWTGGIPMGQLAWVQKHLAEDLRVHPYLGNYYFGLNLTRPPFQDNPELRRALSLAIDREIITEKLLRGDQIPAYGWVPPGVANYTPQTLPYANWSQAERVAEARRLYREAGYSEDNPLSVEIRYNTSAGHRKLALAVAAMWRQHLGVRTQLLNEEWKVFLANRRQMQVTQVFRSGWIGDYNDANTFLEIMHSASGINDVGYHNPRYDALLDAASREADGARRRALLEQAERILLADMPAIPLYFYVSKKLVKPTVRGYRGNILDHHYTRHLRIEPRD